MGARFHPSRPSRSTRGELPRSPTADRRLRNLFFVAAASISMCATVLVLGAIAPGASDPLGAVARAAARLAAPGSGDAQRSRWVFLSVRSRSSSTSELGIRVALGANPRGLAALVLRAGLGPVGAGCAGGFRRCYGFGRAHVVSGLSG